MSENREEILANFQACTGIEDVGEAIFILEENNWDLVSSVNKVVPQGSQSFQPNVSPDVEMVSEVIDLPASPVETATDMLSVGNNVGHPTRYRDMPLLENNVAVVHQPSTSSIPHAKMIKFNIQYGDRVVPISMLDTGTVADIKFKLQRELKIPPCQQVLSGWARMNQYEHTPIKDLSLPLENALHLTVKPNGGYLSYTGDQDNEFMERLKGTYTLKVTNEINGRKNDVQYPGTKTILEVKTDMYSLTDIQVRNQIWSGWPPNIDDQTILALSGISYPEHELRVRANVIANHKTDKRIINSTPIQIDSDDDEFEDASESFTAEDDFFVDNIPTKRTEPLIPEHIEDEIVGSISFVERFTARYGPVHPVFFQGTLEDALKEACSRPAKDRKILGIYLHHDSSVLSNVFCTELLSVESVMELMERNFIFWGWDLTYEANKTFLQNSVSNCLGTTAMHSLRNIPVEKLPAIIIIMKIRSSTDIVSVVYGNVGVNELLTSLIESVDMFSEHQKVEIKEEQERAEREYVKWEQDEAFRESLEADRAKELAKQQQAEAEINARKRIEMEKAKEAAEKEQYRMEVAASLSPEPTSHGDDITIIRFRLPKGKQLERKFLVGTPLKVLFNYLVVEGYPMQEYKVISSWPRRDLTALDENKTLQELKLCPQETVILEER